MEGKRNLRNVLIITAWLVAALLIVLAAGYGLNRLLFSNKKSTAKPFALEKSISYREAISDIQKHYYGDFSLEKITEAAKLAVEQERSRGTKSHAKLEEVGLRALVEALGDQHSSYLTPDEYRRLSEDIKGSFYGVGFVLRYDRKFKRPVVVGVLKGTPSFRVGVKKNDVILSVDGKDTKGKSLDVIVSMIRGRKGTVVVLEIKRAGIEKRLRFKIKREKINIPEIEVEVLDRKVGVIRILNFNSGIGDKVRKTIRELEDKGTRGFILDLRNNPGGLLEEAVKLVSVFVDQGVVVSYQSKGERRVFEMARGGSETRLPLVVLVNEGSASASEIAAGALKDYHRAIIVGRRTFGKGSVQRLFGLKNGGAMKLTVSLYYLPRGGSIDGKGIMPNHVVEFKNEAEKEERAQFDKAKEVLENLMRRTGTLIVPLDTVA